MSKILTALSARGADIIGAELIHWDYKDADIWLDHQHWIRYGDLIRQTNPDVIITLDRDDCLHDHSNVGELYETPKRK